MALVPFAHNRPKTDVEPSSDPAPVISLGVGIIVSLVLLYPIMQLIDTLQKLPPH